MTIAPSDVVAFWKEAGQKMWFARNEAFDAVFRERFSAAHEAAARGKLDDWAGTAEGSLALLILLDQFPRNCFRGQARAFATDPQARQVAARAVDAGQDRAVDNALKRFFYLPFQHSEDLADQDRQLALFQRMERDPGDRWAEHHHRVIATFGRFPHRNAALGRESTAEEQAFLDQDGFRG